MNDWLETIKTVRLPKLAVGAHEDPDTQRYHMPRRAVYEPMDWDVPFGDGPGYSETLTIRTEPDGEVQLCAMEMVAFMEGEQHTDRPACVCPALSNIMQQINDNLSSSDRDKLLPYLPSCVGTRNDGLGFKRAMLWDEFKSSNSPMNLHWTYVERLLKNIFALGKPTGFTKPERVRELEALA